MRSRTKPRLETLEDRNLLSTCHVTRLTDQGIGKGFRGDLRYCINKVNTEPGPDAIDFTVTGTINLTQALPDLSTDLAIDGPGANHLTVRRDTGGDYRIFTIGSGATVQILNLTVADGRLSAQGGASTWGAGIRNRGVLGLGGVRISNNEVIGEASVGKRGGGISNEGVMEILDSSIANNRSFMAPIPSISGLAHGGGIYNHSGASLTILNSTLSGNFTEISVANGSGGFDATGGGIHHAGSSLTIINSTIAGNGAVVTSSGSGFALGGGVYADAPLQIWNSTISANLVSGTVTEGSGISFDVSGELNNSIVSSNTGATNVEGAFSGGSNLIDVDPMLGPLADNGGPTLTMALLPGSPAIDAGDNTDAPEFDQRGPGFPRIVNGTIDIGAFEVQATAIPAPSPRPAAAFARHDMLAMILATADLDSLE